MTLLFDPDEEEFVDDDDLDYLVADFDAFEDRAYIEHYVDKPSGTYDWDYDLDDYPYGFDND